MNESFSSYTPRVVALNYDALKSNTGLQAIDGVRVGNFFALTNALTIEHDEVSTIFNKLDTIAFAPGPRVIGGDLPFRVLWAAWVAGNGIRIGQSSHASDDLTVTSGIQSTLYPSTKPKKLALAFTVDGYPVIAIQKAESTIEIKRQNSDDTIFAFTFSGFQPALFQTALLHSDDVPNDEEIVCLYLREERDTALFLRRESENFAMEHTINPDLPAFLSQLIEIQADNRRVIVLARDEDGSDITLYSEDYVIEPKQDSVGLDADIESGHVFLIGVESDAGQDAGMLQLELFDGLVFDALTASPALPKDKSQLTLQLFDGEYS